MQIEKVKEILAPYVLKNNLELYDVELVKEANELILRVLLDKEGGIDLETLALANDFLSAELDKIDSDMPEYLLEVSSPGAEKPLRNIDEIKKSIGKYIHVELEGMIYEGVLNDFVDNCVVMRINIKGRFKNINVEYSKIKNIRLAVKI